MTSRCLRPHVAFYCDPSEGCQECNALRDNDDALHAPGAREGAGGYGDSAVSNENDACRDIDPAEELRQARECEDPVGAILRLKADLREANTEIVRLNIAWDDAVNWGSRMEKRAKILEIALHGTLRTVTHYPNEGDSTRCVAWCPRCKVRAALAEASHAE